MENLINNFIDWFKSLSDQPQIDEQIINSITSLADWFSQLSLNQQLVVIGFLIILLVLIYFVLITIRYLYLKIRKWSRRKRIPSSINLHLDSDQPKYGSDLKKNMVEMKNDAPYKEKNKKQDI